MRQWINLVESRQNFAYPEPDPDWVERLREKKVTKDTVFPDAKAEALKRKLLQVGGWATIQIDNEPDIDLLLSSGHLFAGRDVEMVEGDVNNCHKNSEWMVKDDPTLQLATGYVYSQDGLWRQHSWVMRGDTILETTPVSRAAYWGVVFPQQLQESYFDDHNNLIAYADGYMRSMGASLHPHAAHPAKDFEWRLDPNYPLSNLNPEVDKVEWMKEEIEMWADEGEPNRYDDEIKGPIRDPIIVIEIENGVGEIIDGWHRTGGSALAGRTTIPAVVGVLKSD